MSAILTSVAAFIVAIGVLVAVHEFGHYWVAHRLGPRVYHLAYSLSDQPAIARALRGPRFRSQQISTRALFHTIETFWPDAIVCTHFLPAELSAGRRRSGRLQVPLCTVVTDFDPHFMWQHAGTVLYCVPTAEARLRLIQDGSIRRSSR